jgi:two-component system, cell cycle sensor histidine kinase and response regulator CckA
VLGASSPGERIRLVRNHTCEPHLSLTAAVMPQMNGREFSQFLKTLCPNLKSLYMPGYTADVIAHHGVLGEGAHFISKPFSTQELAARTREALDAR